MTDSRLPATVLSGFLGAGKQRSSIMFSTIARGAAPKERWPDDPRWKEMLDENWDAAFGDGRQELVFTGVEMDEAKIRGALAACLIGDPQSARFEPESWTRLADPFPEWGAKAPVRQEAGE